MITPINKNIVLKEIEEKKTINGIIIPKTVDALHITFAQVVALPTETLWHKNLKINDYVVLGYSPVWEKRYKHKYCDEEYLIVPETAILGIITNNDMMNLVNVGD